jgi:integrase
MGLGSARDVALAKARDRAAAARQRLVDRIDPLMAKRSDLDRIAPFFVDFVEKLIEAKRSGWKNAKHADQWRYTLSCRRDKTGVLTDDGFCRSLRKLRVDEIGTDDILQVLRPIWNELPETAARLRARLEVVLDGARAAGFRKGDNPARWRAHLDVLLPMRRRLSRGHHAAMPYAEAPAFMQKLRGRRGASNRALEFVILTATRTGETLGAKWPEFDFSRAVWRIPAERMKSARAHEVPLSERCLEILREMKATARDDGFVFPARNGTQLSNMALLTTLRKITGDRNSTAHGFRSTFRDWAGDRTKFPREVAEAALAHVLSDRTEASYRRTTALEKRRQLMRAWADFLAVVPGSNVVSISA